MSWSEDVSNTRDELPGVAILAAQPDPFATMARRAILPSLGNENIPHHVLLKEQLSQIRGGGDFAFRVRKRRIDDEIVAIVRLTNPTGRDLAILLERGSGNPVGKREQ
jgi:hypothetical protein